MIGLGAILAGGVLFAGVKAYKRSKKESTLWLQTAPQMGAENTMLVRYNDVKAYTKTILAPFSQGTRRQQMKDISTETTEVSPYEKNLKRNMAIGFSAMGLTGVGIVLNPMFTLLGLPLILYLYLNFNAVHGKEYVKKRRYGPYLLDVYNGIGPLLTGHFFATSIMTTFFYVNRKILYDTEDRSMQSLANIYSEQPQSAWLVKDGVEIELPFEQVQPGDIIVFNVGEMISVDGTIVQGAARVDQRTLTGESLPVEKEPGDPVFASTMVISGWIHIQVEKAGSETVADQIGHILNHTADYKHAVQSKGETVIDRWSWPTLGLSALTLPLLGPSSAVAVSFANFGYHMRYSAPIGVLNFLHIASQNGILVKDGRSLELLSQIDTVVFDKTGTLTEEQPHVGAIHVEPGIDEADLLQYAATAEYKQTHPIARAILQEAQARNLSPLKIDEATVEIGYGLKVQVAGQAIYVGSDRFMALNEIAIPPHIREIQTTCHQQGRSLVYISKNGQFVGALELHPTIRPEAQQIIAHLKQQQLTTVIISGDHEIPTRSLAQELGVDRYFAETSPEDKAALITKLQAEGKSVCFVGDGINDAIALKQANVSVSLRGAATIATDSAAIVLMDGRLTRLERLFEVAQALQKNQRISYWGTIVPGVICVCGVWFFSLSVFGAMMLYYAGLGFGLSTAMLPLINHRQEMEP